MNHFDFIKKVYIDKIKYVHDNIKIKKKLQNKCKLHTAYDLRLITYHFHNRVECDDLEIIIPFLNYTIEYNFLHNNQGVPYDLTYWKNNYLIGLKNMNILKLNKEL